MESSPTEEYICSICWNLYYNPIKLDCDHIFCHHCIFFWLEKQDEGIKCPKCRRFYSITTELKFDNPLIEILKKKFGDEYSKRKQEVESLFKEEDRSGKIKILYGNYLNKQEVPNKNQKTSEWRFFVKLANSSINIQDYIEKIEVNLDPAYGGKISVLSKPPFEVKLSFGSELDIIFKIHWQKHLGIDPVNFIYYVAFNGGEGKTNSYLLVLKR